MLSIIPFHFKNKISINNANLLLVYATVLNVFYTNIYLKEIQAELWTNNYLRDVPILLVYLVALTLTFSLRHLVIFNILCMTYCYIIYYNSGSKYIDENTIIICTSIIGLSVILYSFVNILRKTIYKNKVLLDELLI